MMLGIDGTVLNVALPTLERELHPSSSGLQWIADSYVLANAVLLLFGGALGDRFGRRNVLVGGLAVFGSASLGASLVDTADGLIAARVVLGLGAAILMPATLSSLTSVFSEPRERATAIGIWAGVVGIGSAIGPLLGGFLLTNFWWGSVFLINVPVAVIAIVAALWVMPDSRAPVPPSLDPVAVLLSALGLSFIVWAIIEAPISGWGAGKVLGALVAGAVCLVAFVTWEQHRANPIIDLSLFRIPVFSTASGAVAVMFFGMMGLSFLLSQYLQFVDGDSAMQVGIRFIPSAAGMLIVSPLSSRVVARIGLRASITTGMALAAAGSAMLIGVTRTSGYPLVGLSFTLSAVGMSLSMAPASNAIMGSLPPDRLGGGAGLRSTVQLVGGSFGVAVLGTLASSRYRSTMAAALHGPLRGLPASADAAARDQIGAAIEASNSLHEPLATSLRQAAASGYVAGIHLAAIVGAIVGVAGAVAASRVIPRGTHGTPSSPVTPLSEQGE